VFTNLSRDHLDYHGTPERYLASKAQLFMQLPTAGAAVLNAADPSSALLAEVVPEGARRLAYAARPVDPACAALPLALEAADVRVDRSGTRITLAPSPLADALGGALSLSIIGSVHAENALAAAVAAHAAGYSPDAIRRGLAHFAGVPGRFEVVSERPLVVVDFAHTPDALEAALRLARSLITDVGGSVTCVFGCGGDRDPGKRAPMGEVAGRLADFVVLTTDNPRGEDPVAIAEMVAAGLRGSSAKLERILERAEAIETAIRRATPADVVVIAGKGHERTQVMGERVVPFDDRLVARAALRSGGGTVGT
jgi:UDP-N-acetylmuramoyl-L-alanyl-D-glutamate--2,6-diaminopimelate ligase